MDKIFWAVVFLLVIAAIFALEKLPKLIKINTLYRYVGWCLIDDSMGSSSLSKLMQCIEYTQARTKMPLEYCILESQEKEYAWEIFKHFQLEWARSYFNDELKIVAHKKRLDHGDYFCVALYSFLSMHECDYTFLGHDMYKLISRKDYGSWGVRHYDAIYELNDFSVVFHKLQLITYAGCLHSQSLNSDGSFSKRQYDDIKRVLDTKQIEISRM